MLAERSAEFNDFVSCSITSHAGLEQRVLLPVATGLAEQEELAELAGQERATWPGELGADDEVGIPSSALVGDVLGKSKAALGFGRWLGDIFPTAPTPENHCWAQAGAEIWSGWIILQLFNLTFNLV